MPRIEVKAFKPYQVPKVGGHAFVPLGHTELGSSSVKQVSFPLPPPLCISHSLGVFNCQSPMLVMFDVGARASLAFFCRNLPATPSKTTSEMTGSARRRALAARQPSRRGPLPVEVEYASATRMVVPKMSVGDGGATVAEAIDASRRTTLKLWCVDFMVVVPNNKPQWRGEERRG